jgi:hypothetical protein
MVRLARGVGVVPGPLQSPPPERSTARVGLTRATRRATQQCPTTAVARRPLDIGPGSATSVSAHLGRGSLDQEACGCSRVDVEDTERETAHLRVVPTLRALGAG